MLGLSFKADTDDLRGSPAVNVARRLVAAGHSVVAYDPAVRADRASAAVPGMEVASDPYEVFRDADAVVIATEWPQFGELDLHAAGPMTRRSLLFDGRRMIEPREAVDAGFAYRGVGTISLDPETLAVS